MGPEPDKYIQDNLPGMGDRPKTSEQTPPECHPISESSGYGPNDRAKERAKRQMDYMQNGTGDQH